MTELRVSLEGGRAFVTYPIEDGEYEAILVPRNPLTAVEVEMRRLALSFDLQPLARAA